MIIHSMTATFGKLEHETLTLKPGLNILSGGNEWGKSTWCAFLAAMLYGVDTRTKTTKNNLSDKEHFAPWSGSPMSGRMEITWQGRNITIERKSAGRAPMGKFRAFETDTGIPVTELTGENCGEKLLGVERSVFVRTGFIRFRDMGVTDDEALRRRLNNLVTTGDENNSADFLSKNLRDLKNRIRYNRTGLLPQEEAQRDQLEQRKQELEQLDKQCGDIRRRMDEVEDWRVALENHRMALAWEDAQEDARKVARAKQAREDARHRFEDLSALCQALPEKETVRDLLDEIQRLENKLRDLEEQLRQLPPLPPPEDLPPQFDGLSSHEALDWAKTDADRYHALQGKKSFLWIFALVLIGAGVLMLKAYSTPGLICCGVGLVLLVWWLVEQLFRSREIRRLEEFYGSGNTEQWLSLARQYARGLEQRQRDPNESTPEQRELEEKIQELKSNIDKATQGQSLEQCKADWEAALSTWNAFEETMADYRLSQEHLDVLQSMARTAPAPEFPDRLEYNEGDTIRLLYDCSQERRRLENLLGQYQGKREAMGADEEITVQLTKSYARIRELEQKWQALTIAQEALAEAQNRLQRRFAPKIVRRAEELMGRMTGGRYRRLSLGEDFSIRAGAENEDTLQSLLWRSDGTVDQLYLALRLAVSAELIPEAPMILDDALVRFDDQRLKAALDILKDESESRQVILFTCHSREANMV